MDIRTILRLLNAIAAITCILFGLSDGGQAAPSALPVLVASSDADVTPLLAKAVAAGRCWASDVEYGHGGEIVEGTTTQALAAGRYRVHVLVARSPLGDVYSNAVELAIRAAGARTTPNPLRFAVPNEFVDVPLLVTLTGSQALRVGVTWSAPQDAKLNKQKYTDPATLDPEQTTAPDEGGAQLPPTAADGSILTADLPRIPVSAAVCAAVVEKLPPIDAAVLTDKITYRVGEAGIGTVTLHNDADHSLSATINCSIALGLDTTLDLGKSQVNLAAGEETIIRAPIDTKTLQWGAEFRATVTVDGVSETTSTVFAVHDNFWALAMLAGQGPDDDRKYKDPSVAAAMVAQWRKNGQTGFEMFFWAPDDFGDFNPQAEDWLSGQTLYQESVTGTKNLIAAAHANGMAATVYSNLWGGDGVSGFELMRKHPDWFGGASYGSEWLEFWNRLQEHKVPDFEQWCLNWLTGDTAAVGQAAIKYHADQLIESHRQFGWDGVRYDSYDSTPWVQWATKQTRALVGAAIPTFGFGYNTNPKTDAQRGALDVMVGGGEMTMVEYADPESYTSLAGYIGELAGDRDTVWAHGGNLGPIYRSGTPQGFKSGLAVPIDALSISSAMLATGSHAYYDALDHDLGNYPEFALRYSQYIWDTSLMPVRDPSSVVEIDADRQPLMWQTLAKTRDSGDQHVLILHLLNAAPDYTFFTDDALKTPPPMRNLKLTLLLPPDSKILNAFDLSPLRGLNPTPLPPTITGGGCQITVPEVRFYDIVVVTFTAAKGLS